MEKNDKELAIVAAFLIGRAVYKLENISLKDDEVEEVKTELSDYVDELATIADNLRDLAKGKGSL